MTANNNNIGDVRDRALFESRRRMNALFILVCAMILLAGVLSIVGVFVPDNSGAEPSAPPAVISEPESRSDNLNVELANARMRQTFGSLIPSTVVFYLLGGALMILAGIIGLVKGRKRVDWFGLKVLGVLAMLPWLGILVMCVNAGYASRVSFSTVVTGLTTSASYLVCSILHGRFMPKE